MTSTSGVLYLGLKLHTNPLGDESCHHLSKKNYFRGGPIDLICLPIKSEWFCNLLDIVCSLPRVCVLNN